MANVDPISLVDPQYIKVLQGKPHPMYAGVLGAAHRAGLLELSAKIVQAPGPENGNTAICEATAIFSGPDGRERIFTEVGDADDVNCNKMIAQHKIRMAATRAKGRALRDALGLGVALVEEMGGTEEANEGNGAAHRVAQSGGQRGGQAAAARQPVSRSDQRAVPVDGAAGDGGEAAGQVVGRNATAPENVKHWPTCAGCGEPIRDVETAKGLVSASTVVHISRERWGEALCHACGRSRTVLETANVPAGQVA